MKEVIPMDWPEVAAYAPLVIAAGIGLILLWMADGGPNKAVIQLRRKWREWTSEAKNNTHS